MDIQVTATVPPHQQPAMRPVSNVEVWPYLLVFVLMALVAGLGILVAELIKVIIRRFKK
jgi:hypothetical protein